jgi:hypothetical protein
MFVDSADCLARWLSFATSVEVIEGNGLGRRQIVHGRYHILCNSIEQEITAYEPARLVSWTHTEEHPAVSHIPRLDRSTVITVQLIPEGAGTRVRIDSAQEPAGLLRGLAMRLVTRRAVERHIKISLEQLAGMLKGRIGA